MFDKRPFLDQTLYRENDGRYVSYRIPGIVACGDHTLVACLEAREDPVSDWGKIDIIIFVSNDGGNTWRETMTITSPDGASCTFNNPCLAFDGKTVFLVYHRDYRQAFLVTSEDRGVAWNNAREITSVFQAFDWQWNVCAAGPGHGICTSDKRIIFPVWLADGVVLPDGTRRHWPSVAGFITSRDHGLTWRPGILAKELNSGNETSVCELPDKCLLFDFRTRDEARKRTIGYLDPHGDRFEDIHAVPQLDDPMCFGSVLCIEGFVVQVNCHDPYHRKDLSLFVSPDFGKTWAPVLLIDPVGGYADLAWSGESLYILYERTDPVTGHVAEICLKGYHETGKQRTVNSEQGNDCNQ